MAYSDFLELNVFQRLQLKRTPARDLFPNLQAIPAPAWLEAYYNIAAVTSLTTEKARSEMLVAPLLAVAAHELRDYVNLFSGERLDADPAQKLSGECDFLIGSSDGVGRIAAPLVTVVEAKKGEIEGGLGQCIAQMVGVRTFNQQANQPVPRVYGCVTNGEVWQFLLLQNQEVTQHHHRLFINEPGLIIAAFVTAIREAFPTSMLS